MIGKKGFTLVELIVTMSIIGILAAMTSGMVISLVRMVVYIPREIKARTVAQEALDIMIEGDAKVRGMRYANEIIVAGDDVFYYRVGYPANNDKRNVGSLWVYDALMRIYSDLGDPVTGLEDKTFKFSEWIPYYATPGSVVITKRYVGAAAQPVFKYYKANGVLWNKDTDPLNTIRRAEISFVVSIGGTFEAWGGSYTVTSGVEIKQYL